MLMASILISHREKLQGDKAMANGLDDVVAAETVLSDVDGLGGRLTIRGHSLGDLAGRWSYARVVRLLLGGFFDDLPGDAELAARLGEARVEVFERLAPSLPLLAPLELYSGMRAGMAPLPGGEALTDDGGRRLRGCRRRPPC